MNIKKLFNGIAVFASTAMFSLSTVHTAYAAPGALATAPLFLSTIVEPNVFLTLDDSGSMDWGPMVAEGTGGFTTSGGLPFVDSTSCTPCTLRRGHYFFGGTRDVLPPANGTDPLWDLTWLIRNHNGNRNYYNPSVKYSPWVGTEADGTTAMYTDANPAAALKDAENPGGPSVNLTVLQSFTEDGVTSNDVWLPTYFIWIDTDLDGVIEQSDARTEVRIPITDTTAMNNFANWFQYYRKRMDSTKRIIGGTINNTDASRMGLRWFNDGHDLDVETMSDTTNKRTLLEELYKQDPGGSTPMRRALRDTGQYFKTSGGGAPILSAALGGECQQNFNILMSDGFWNGGKPKGIGHRDRDGGSKGNNTIYDGDGRTTPPESNDGGNYADDFKDTLADVAMKYYEEDLRKGGAGLANNVPIQPGIDEAPHQHLVNYTIAFGLNGDLDPLVDDPLAPAFNWLEPIADSPTTIDDMWHAAYNSRGEYLSAQDPEQLAASLDAAISDIAERTASAAAVSINSAKLTTESVVFLAEFNSNRWQGNLFAFSIDPDTGVLATTPSWGAGDVLNARGNPRVMITHDGVDGIPFQWANLSVAQKADLNTTPAGGVDAFGIDRLNYMRGDRSNEGTGKNFRVRASLLSDLVNSGPVFVGAPELNWPDVAPFPNTAGSLYSEFKNGPAKSRQGVVYVGSNDGMLHGFNETDGEEVLAYFPNNLFSTGASEGIHYLTDPGYGHKYYNDLTPTLSDVVIGGSWTTVLISGQRGGGRGIYALDVTDPTGFSETNASNLVLWEFTNADDADLGFTYSKPQIALANNGQWVAIFGNGYNDTGDGEAKLFILDIEMGVNNAWTTSGAYKEITTNHGTPGNRNGLATPALADTDGDGDVDRVYAGDLEGNMWAFDLSSSSPSSWNITSSEPLFTTLGNRPITAQPTVSKHPNIGDSGSNSPNLLVFFGAGQYLTNADKSTTDLNHFYGVWDKGDDGLHDTDLVQQTFENGFTNSNGDPVRVITNNNVDYLGTDYGWFFELPDSGERSVTKPVVRGDVVFFNTFTPEIDPCSTGGTGISMVVDIVTGGSPTSPAFDANGDGVIDENDTATDASGNIRNIAGNPPSDGWLPEPVFIEDIVFNGPDPTKVKALPTLPNGRFSWQELIQ